MSTATDFLRQLPEFPRETFEAVGALERSERGPFVTLRPHSPPAPQEPSVPVAAGPTKPSITVRSYYTQAIYPQVICYEPGLLTDGLGSDLGSQPSSDKDASPADITAVAGRERFYKLSTLESVELRNPLFCRVSGGPWLASVKQTPSCNYGEADRWDFQIISVPEVALVWWGAWEDMPPFPSLTVIMSDLVPDPTHPPQTSCCTGFTWCYITKSCIQNGLPCEEQHPT
jgi:hypothetical protein